MYDERPKMKRDARLKAGLFLGKKTAFSQASLFIFGRCGFSTKVDHCVLSGSFHQCLLYDNITIFLDVLDLLIIRPLRCLAK